MLLLTPALPVFAKHFPLSCRKNNCFYSLGTGNCTRWRNPAAQRYPVDMGPQDDLPFNRENNRFYRLGTGNFNRQMIVSIVWEREIENCPTEGLILVVWDAEKNFMNFPVGK